MPWVAIAKRGRRPGRIARWRAAHREPLLAWTIGLGSLVAILGLLFALVHRLA